MRNYCFSFETGVMACTIGVRRPCVPRRLRNSFIASVPRGSSSPHAAWEQGMRA